MSADAPAAILSNGEHVKAEPISNSLAVLDGLRFWWDIVQVRKCADDPGALCLQCQIESRDGFWIPAIR
jgi:hypothetical protein